MWSRPPWVSRRAKMWGPACMLPGPMFPLSPGTAHPPRGPPSPPFFTPRRCSAGAIQCGFVAAGPVGLCSGWLLRLLMHLPPSLLTSQRSRLLRAAPAIRVAFEYTFAYMCLVGEEGAKVRSAPLCPARPRACAQRAYAQRRDVGGALCGLGKPSCEHEGG